MNEAADLTRERVLEASPAVRTLIRGAALSLGASDLAADAAARSGCIELESRTVCVEPSPDGDALLLSTALSSKWLSTPSRRRLALRTTTALWLQAGIAFCASLAGPVLMCRWPAGTTDPVPLAAWIQRFAGVANVVESESPPA